MGRSVASRTISGLEVALAMWHRRKWLVLLVIALLLSAIAAVARSLPNIYESTATVLVERQQMSERLVGPPADDLETRLRTISQQIMSRTRLYQLINRFDLYPALRLQATQDKVVERMRRDIKLQFSGVRQATGLDATIAFSLSYRGRDPEKVMQVTNALAALYVEENTRIREQQTEGTTEFLGTQLADAKRQLQEQEEKINAFKARHIGELPEQQAVNLAELERLNGRAHAIQDRRSELAKQLTEQPRPGGDNTPAARLAKLRLDLADLRTRYTDEHPEVVRAKEAIAALDRQIAADGGKGSTAGQPKDPRAAAEVELASLRSEEQALRHAIAGYEARVENAPLMELELQQLSRDYTTAKERYQSLLQRYEDAQMAGRMQQRLRSEQFRILDPAMPSRQPVGPHRAQLLMMGLMVSLGVAVEAVLLAEAGDTSFHTVDDLRGFTGAPVLVRIPPIITEADVRRRRRRFGLAVLAAVCGVAAVIVASTYLARSNEALINLLAGGRL